MSKNFLIREYRPEDFDALTIVWRISREKSLPQLFNNAKSHFFYEDRAYFRDHILKENNVWVRRVMKQILCNYRQEAMFAEDDIALYVPQVGQRQCLQQ